MSREFVSWLITALSALLTGFCIHWTIQVLQAPDCPQEDSCVVRYYDHDSPSEEVHH
jgi:hypothetical protein